MNIATLLSSLALGSTLTIGGVLLAPSVAGENRAVPTGDRQWLSIAQVHEKLDAAGYRNVEKIERERGGYEARATVRNGDRVKLHVHPQNGEVLNQRGESKRHSREAENKQSSADCTKRRCRDDLPPQPANPAPATR